MAPAPMGAMILYGPNWVSAGKDISEMTARRPEPAHCNARAMKSLCVDRSAARRIAETDEAVAKAEWAGFLRINLRRWREVPRAIFGY